MGGKRRLAALAAAMAATILGLPAAAGSVGADEAGAGDASSGAEVVRYSGGDPYEQSLEVAQAMLATRDGPSEWVVLASSETWTDAAAAGPLAASLDASVLLVPPSGLQGYTEHPGPAEFLESAGVTRAVIVGNPVPVPPRKPSRHFGSGMLPSGVERVWGNGPAATSLAAARRLGTPADFGNSGRTVIIASDQSVADAVAVGPLAAAGPFPLLLTGPDALDPQVEAFLAGQRIEHVVLVGGAAAIAPAIRDAIETAGVQVTRLAGIDRYHTAALAMDLLAESPRCADEAIDGIGLALADEPRLALTAGRLLGPQCIPLLFTDADGLAPVTQNHLYLYRHRTGIEPAWHLIGDEVTIDPTVIERPPVRMATVADNPEGDGQHIVVLDEHHQPTRYLLDAGFDGITEVRWTSDRRSIVFVGVRDGAPIIYERLINGDWKLFEGIEGGTQSTYELDLRSGIARAQSPFPSWYRRPIEDTWADPLPSPDRKYIVFRAPTEDYSGHSLFAIHVDTGEVQQLTHNTTDDTHHVVSSEWLPDGRRFIYTHVTIAQLKNPVPPEFPDDPNRAYAYAEPRQFGSECGNVPQQRAHIVDVATGFANPLPHDGYLVDQPLLASPDGRFIAIKSYQDYEFAPERNIHRFFYWRCTHDGIGSPSISVYDIGGPEPRSITEASLSGYDPTWSPDSNFFVFRAPTGTHAGHSLLAVDAETGDVAHITRNQSDEHHHIAQHWLPDESKLLYTVQSIEVLAEPCHHLSPEQERPSGTPHVEAHVVDLPHGRSVPLEYDGVISGGYSGSGFSVAPDGRHVSFVAYSSYLPVSSQASCGYAGSGDSQFYLYDIIMSSPRPAEFDNERAYARSWSPDGRYLSVVRYEVSRGGNRSAVHSILDTRDGSAWTVPASELFDIEASLSAVAWTPDSPRILYHAAIGDYRNRTHAMLIADVAAKQALTLAMPADYRIYPNFYGFSADGQAVIHSTGFRGTAEIGQVLVHDVHDGALIGIYDMYGATPPGEPVLSNDEGYGDLSEGFRFSAEWAVDGIYASGEYYLWLYHDY